MKSDIKRFLGNELLQLQIGVYQIIFAFDDDLLLSVESTIRFFSAQSTGEWLPGDPSSAAIFASLVGKKIVDAEEGVTGLSLRFDGDTRITVAGFSPGGEAYQLTYPGSMHIV